jgi:arylformamidase
MSVVFRDFTPSQVAQEYNARGTVNEADFNRILHDYRTKTDAAKAALPCHLGVKYGESAEEFLDIYLSQNINAPVFIFIHGGYWRLLGAQDSGFMAENFCAAGAHVVVINYALAPNVTLHEIIAQNQRAMRWIYANIAQYNGNPDALYVAGSSAGGHLAALMTHEKGVIGACLISGLFDLTPMQWAKPQEWLKLLPHDIEEVSPWFNPPPASVPLIFTYGGNETDEFKRQSNDFMRLCAARGNDACFVGVPNSNHFDIVFALADKNTGLSHEIFTVMGLN